MEGPSDAPKPEFQPTPGPTDVKKPASPQSINFLKEEFDFFIKDFKSKRDTSRFATNLMKAASIIIGGVLTVLIGVRSFLAPENNATIVITVSVITLTLSAAMTALSSWEAFSAHHGKWIRYRTSLSMLYIMRHEFRHKESLGDILVEDVAKYFGQLMLVVHETNQEWMSLRGPAISGHSQGTKKLLS